MTELLKWLRENNAAGFFVVLLFAGAIFATWWIVKAIGRFKKMEKVCDGIPAMETKINTGVNLSQSIEKKIDTQTEKFGVIATNITALVTFLTTKYPDLQSGLFQSHSPIQLTDVGVELLTACGGKTYIDNNINSLMAEMESQSFKSGLDVQSFASSTILSKFNTDGFIHIRNHLFQNPIFLTSGKKEIPANAANVSQVMAIYLRDKYFAKHPELKDVE